MALYVCFRTNKLDRRFFYTGRICRTLTYYFQDQWYVGSDPVDPNNPDPEYDELPPIPPPPDAIFDDPDEPDS